MKALLYNIAIFSSCLLLSPSLQAQYEATRVTTKTFALTNDGEFTAENKYGDIIITGWEKDSVRITSRITVKKKSESDAKNLLDRIAPSYSVFGRYVSVTTEIKEKGDSFLEKLFNEINPIDFDKSDVDIDYEIMAPEKVAVELSNDFGDLILTEWAGKLKANLRHGDLRITDPLATANIKVAFGDINARSIDDAFITIRSGKLKLHDSKNLKLDSNGSELELGSIDFLDMDSNKDEVHIEMVNRLKSDVRYSTIFIEEAGREIVLDLSLADVRVSKVKQADCLIHITENNSEVDINVSGLALELKADMEGGTLRLPRSTSNLDTKVLDEKNKIRQVSASYGTGKSGNFTLNGRKGYVILRELD